MTPNDEDNLLQNANSFGDTGLQQIRRWSSFWSMEANHTNQFFQRQKWILGTHQTFTGRNSRMANGGNSRLCSRLSGDLFHLHFICKDGFAYLFQTKDAKSRDRLNIANLLKQTKLFPVSERKSFSLLPFSNSRQGVK